MHTIKKQLLAALVLLLTASSGMTQTTVNYKITYNNTTCLYEARVVVKTGSISGTPPFGIPFPSVFTIALPAIYPDGKIQNVTMVYPVPGLGVSDWIEGNGLRAPNASPAWDYHPFSMDGGGGINNYPAMNVNDELVLFTFSLPAINCAAGVRPYINGGTPAGDPTSVQFLAAGDPGIGIDNAFEIFPILELYVANDPSIGPAAPIVTTGSTTCAINTLTTNLNITKGACASTLTYAWTGPSGFSAATPNITLTTPTNPAGSYQLTTKDDLGCVTTQTYILDAGTCAPGSIISGTVWNDANGTATQDGTEVPTNAGGVYANLVNPTTHAVIASVLVDPITGAYSFTGSPSTAYEIILTPTSQTPGNTLTASSLPTSPTGDWVNTGTNVLGAASPDNKTGVIAVTTPANGSSANQNFGIEKKPTAATTVHPDILTNGYTQPVDILKFVSNDIDGKVNWIVITNFPTTLASISIDGFKYYPSNWPVGGFTLPVTGGILQSTVGIIPLTGATTGNIPFIAVDNAGVRSASPGRVDLTFVTILPANGLKLVAQLNNNKKAQLTWQTSTESNTSYFEVQRSDNNTNGFYAIGRVNAAGNSNAHQAYAMTDTKVIATSSYFRVVLFDKDGKQAVSTVVVLKPSAALISLYPNPTKNFVVLTGATEGSELTITDMIGKRLISKVATGGAERFNVSALASGSYLINVVSADGVVSILKFNKQ